MQQILLTLVLTAGAAWGQTDSWQEAEKNAQLSRRVVKFADRYAFGWLTHTDPASGLFPRNISRDFWWNAQDCAADNYPFMVLTAFMTDNYYLKQNVRHILQQEQKLCNRVDSLPDDFLFSTQKFRVEQVELDRIIFGSAEYCKDGLIPVTEWLGPSDWLVRMQQLTADIWKHAKYDSPAGKIPSTNVEVNGDLLQTMGRLYWMTGNDQYKQWCFRLADHYLLHDSLIKEDSLRLRDHGCEILGGLSEAYVIAAYEDPDRRQRYKPEMHAVLDNILKYGVNEDGFMYNMYNPSKGEATNKDLSDGWGYVYNAYLTVALIDGENLYRDAVARTLSNLHKYMTYPWEKGSADDLADPLEGAINLIARIPGEVAFKWIDTRINTLFERQRDDGIAEGWHGDGNLTRTCLMYALWKTQGITAAPWREDLQLGAVRQDDGSLRIWIKSDFPWNGRLRFDRPRHKDYFHMPLDYPRINQWPEWFTVNSLARYQVAKEGGSSEAVAGKALLSYPLSLEGGKPVKLTVTPLKEQASLRTMRYKTQSAEAAAAWQKDLRGRLFELMKLADLRKAEIPLDAKTSSSQDKGEYTLTEMTIRSTRGREINVLVGLPKGKTGPLPAVVCIHGHGGSRQIVYDGQSIYRGFADALARKGFVTISTDVGQHDVREQGRTLMGERLWDLMRCVDYLRSMPEVDKSRIGCAGLSLGGEMAMWLGAMDERIAATVSSGYLTTMDQMEQNHCLCWKFDGLRELADWADIYSLIAPRALQCQNGLQEPPTDFCVPLARQAMREIKVIYLDLNRPDGLELDVHPEAHVIDLPPLVAFLEKHLKKG